MLNRWTLRKLLQSYTKSGRRDIQHNNQSIQRYCPIAIATSSIIVTAATVGDGNMKDVLIIGDSTTAGGVSVVKLHEKFETDVMNINTIGTQGSCAISA